MTTLLCHIHSRTALRRSPTRQVATGTPHSRSAAPGPRSRRIVRLPRAPASLSPHNPASLPRALIRRLPGYSPLHSVHSVLASPAVPHRLFAVVTRVRLFGGVSLGGLSAPADIAGDLICAPDSAPSLSDTPSWDLTAEPAPPVARDLHLVHSPPDQRPLIRLPVRSGVTRSLGAFQPALNARADWTHLTNRRNAQ